jgi:hypothetical protein
MGDCNTTRIGTWNNGLMKVTFSADGGVTMRGEIAYLLGVRHGKSDRLRTKLNATKGERGGD